MNVKEGLWLKHLKRPMYRSLFPRVLRISEVLNLDRTSSCLQQVTPREAVQTYQKSISFEFEVYLNCVICIVIWLCISLLMMMMMMNTLWFNIHLLACFDSKSVIWEPWLHLQSFTLLWEGTHLKTRSQQVVYQAWGSESVIKLSMQKNLKSLLNTEISEIHGNVRTAFQRRRVLSSSVVSLRSSSFSAFSFCTWLSTSKNVCTSATKAITALCRLHASDIQWPPDAKLEVLCLASWSNPWSALQHPGTWRPVLLITGPTLEDVWGNPFDQRSSAIPWVPGTLSPAALHNTFCVKKCVI